jgi:hypothetical protein
VDQALAHYELVLTDLKQTGPDTLYATVLVPFEQRQRIAQFMQEVKRRGYRTVDTGLIQLEKDLYRSTVEVKK